MSKLTDSQEWKALEAHAEVAKTWHMKELAPSLTSVRFTVQAK